MEANKCEGWFGVCLNNYHQPHFDEVDHAIACFLQQVGFKH